MSINCSISFPLLLGFPIFLVVSSLVKILLNFSYFVENNLPHQQYPLKLCTHLALSESFESSESTISTFLPNRFINLLSGDVRPASYLDHDFPQFSGVINLERIYLHNVIHNCPLFPILSVIILVQFNIIFLLTFCKSQSPYGLIFHSMHHSRKKQKFIFDHSILLKSLLASHCLSSKTHCLHLYILY